jgi:rare lipoprotein A
MDPTPFLAPFFAGVALLAGCSSAPVVTEDKDGFPEAHVVPPNLEMIADATPKPEPRSKYGNPANYEVFGQRYFVLGSAAGYKERGGASWYGTKFNGRRTSSGEPYDMFAMTAAHKTLPLPTYVRVTRLSSGKSVVVKVNDRGPFHQGRIIDLSYAAALRLDLLKDGSAEVEVEAIDPGALAPPAVARASAPFLEVATTDDPVYAIALREQLAGLGLAAVEIRTVERGNDVLHRVIAGPCRDAATLAEAQRRLAAEHPGAKPVTE